MNSLPSKPLYGSLVLLSLSMLAAGCGGGGSAPGGESGSPAGDPGQSAATTEPAVVKIFTPTSTTDEEFNLYFVEPVRKKYPHITIESVKKGKGTDLPDLLTANQVPDIIIDANGSMADKLNFDLLEDITPLVNKLKIDLTAIDPVVLDAVKTATKTGELYGLPHWLNFNALYYNKDIFDKFGVSYPADGMTWDQTITLAEKLSRSDAGVDFKGLHYEHIARLSMALSPDFVNRTTERANVNNEMWKRVFELGYKINHIPGNMPAQIDAGYTDAFYVKQNTAMLASINTLFAAQKPLESGMRLGVAQYPAYPEKRNTYGYVDAGVLLLSKTSKVKEQAMQVIEAATSPETQLAAARKLGKVSVLKNQEMKKQFAADISFMKGIDLQSVFKSSPAPAPAFSVNTLLGRRILQAKFKDYVEGKVDVNTALKQAEEEINKEIAATMAK